METEGLPAGPGPSWQTRYHCTTVLLSVELHAARSRGAAGSIGAARRFRCRRAGSTTGPIRAAESIGAARRFRCRRAGSTTGPIRTAGSIGATRRFRCRRAGSTTGPIRAARPIGAAGNLTRIANDTHGIARLHIAAGNHEGHGGPGHGQPGNQGGVDTEFSMHRVSPSVLMNEMKVPKR